MKQEALPALPGAGARPRSVAASLVGFLASTAATFCLAILLGAA